MPLQFSTQDYLIGRLEELRAQSFIYEEGCVKHSCTQAKISELHRLLTYIEVLKERNENQSTSKE